MIFGSVPLSEAEGAILAHSVALASGRIPKGRVLSPEDVELLARNNIEAVIVARLEAGDVAEDAAAEAIASAIPQQNLRLSVAATGRVNLYATASGLFCANRAHIDAVNRIDPAITLACLADHVPVEAGDMVATVKIIPLAVAGHHVEAAAAHLRSNPPFVVKPFVPHEVVLVATELPSLKTSTMNKTAKVLQQRLVLSGSRLVEETRVPHTAAAVSAAVSAATSRPGDRPRMVVVFGASAVVDTDDVIPAAIRKAGGHVEQVGLPVDPGNLLVLGRVGNIPVVGAPGCARSPKENGFDWVLNRLLAGELPDRAELTGLGVGGLLMEIPSRPRPRDTSVAAEEELAVGALLMAAGQARRMGGIAHKLLADFDGIPLVRRTASVLTNSLTRPVVAITGHRNEEIVEALTGLDVTTDFNPNFAEGMGTSLAQGFAAPEFGDVTGILVMLADMPAVTPAHVDALVSAFRQHRGGVIVRATGNGKRGNPIILPRHLFEKVRRLEGDVGARALIEASGLPIVEVEIGDAAHIDVDTPEAVIAAGGLLKG